MAQCLALEEHLDDILHLNFLSQQHSSTMPASYDVCGHNINQDGRAEDFIDMNIPIDRTESFYHTADTHRVGNLFVRKYFHPSKNQFLIYWMKKAYFGLESSVENSYLSITSNLLGEFIKKLKKLIREVEITPFDDLPKRLDCPDGALTDHTDRSYWSSTLCENVGPEPTLVLRYFKSLSGLYYIRIWAPRKYNLKYSNWIGKTLSIPLGDCKMFVELLERFANEIAVAETERIAGILEEGEVQDAV